MIADALRNTRHHTIRSMIADALRKWQYEVHEEVHGISQDGSCRRFDIIAITPGSSTGFIIDPTIRNESHKEQPEEVHSEKCRIYDPTIRFYSEKYGLTSITVIGLMVGARGTIPQLFVKFCRQFHLHNDFIYNISLAAIRGSLAILRNHLYSTNN